MFRKTILLVDDSTTALLMERFIFRNEPYELVTATNGVEAIEMARARRPDLILLDMTMPQLDGLQTCRQLRENAETRSIPVVIIANRGEADGLHTRYDCGFTDFVMKPINAIELVMKVRTILGRGVTA